MRSDRSVGSRSSGTSLDPSGVARCPLCHALTRTFAGASAAEALLVRAEAPQPPAELVDHLLNLELGPGDDVAIASLLCQFHSFHRRRYELWIRCDQRIRQCALDDRGLEPRPGGFQDMATELERMDEFQEMSMKVYSQSIERYVKQLQQDMRDSVRRALMDEALRIINDWQCEIDEVDHQIGQKLGEKTAAIRDVLGKCEDSLRAEIGLRQMKKTRRLQQVFMGEYRELQSQRCGNALGALKETVAMEQVEVLRFEKELRYSLGSKLHNVRSREERGMAIWVDKIEQLRDLQHWQIVADRDLVLSRVENAVKRLEKEQTIEFRRIFQRFSQHAVRMRTLLERLRRTRGVDAEAFAICALRREIAPQEVSLAMKARGLGSPGSPGFRSPYKALGSPGNEAPNELRNLADFLARRYCSISDAFAAMDLNGNGHVTASDLSVWLREFRYPGNASMLLTQLDLRGYGYLKLQDFAPLGPAFSEMRIQLSSAAPCSSLVAALIAACVVAASGVEEAAPSFRQVQAAAARCARTVASFLTEPRKPPETPFAHEATREERIAARRAPSSVKAKLGALTYGGYAEDRRSFMSFGNEHPSRREPRSERQFTPTRARPLRSLSPQISPRAGLDAKKRGGFFKYTSAQGAAPPPKCVSAFFGGSTKPSRKTRSLSREGSPKMLTRSPSQERVADKENHSRSYEGSPERAAHKRAGSADARLERGAKVLQTRAESAPPDPSRSRQPATTPTKSLAPDTKATSHQRSESCPEGTMKGQRSVSVEPVVAMRRASSPAQLQEAPQPQAVVRNVQANMISGLQQPFSPVPPLCFAGAVPQQMLRPSFSEIMNNGNALGQAANPFGKPRRPSISETSTSPMSTTRSNVTTLTRVPLVPAAPNVQALCPCPMPPIPGLSHAFSRRGSIPVSMAGPLQHSM